MHTLIARPTPIRRSKIATTFLVVIATCANVLATGGVYWFHGSITGNEPATTHVSGLWLECDNGRCFAIIDEPLWKLICRYFSLASVCVSVVGVLLLILSLMFVGPDIRWLSSFFTVSFLLSLATLILFTYKVAGNYNITFGWSYVFAWVNIILLIYGIYKNLQQKP